MKYKLKGLLIFLIMITSNILFSQSKSGQIEGIVKDHQTGEVLPYASVGFQVINTGTVTDDKGFYQIKGIKPGEYNVNISFVGYKDTTITIVLIGNDKIIRNISLKPEGTDVEEVVVTAQAFGQMKAINNQLNATSITNVVSDVKIRELPDANAAEALSRLPGVSVARVGGEAVSVNIRGVGANTVYVNGMRLDGNLGAISSTMIGGIELSKAFMPDQDADILGGAVDFKMREASAGLKNDITLRTGYNNFSKTYKNQDISALISDRFFKDKLGVMLSFSWDRKDRSTDLLSANYLPEGNADSYILKPVLIQDISLTSVEKLNNRYGVVLFTDYKLTNGRLFYQMLYSLLNSDDTQYVNNMSGTQSQTSYSTKIGGFKENSVMNGLGGEHSLLGAKLDWVVSYSQKDNEQPNDLTFSMINRNGMSGVFNNTAKIDTLLRHTNHDLDKTYLNNLVSTNEKIYSNELAAKLNIEVPFTLGEKIAGYIKFGGKFRDITRGKDKSYGMAELWNGWLDKTTQPTFINGLPQYNFQRNSELNIMASGFAEPNTGRDYSLYNTPVYFPINASKIEDAYDVMSSHLAYPLSQEKEDYTNNEKYYAAYFMTGINIGEMITFTPGVRFERNSYSTSAKRNYSTNWYSLTPGNMGIDTIVTEGASTQYFFPMIHLKFKPLSWFDLRLAYTETVSRPSFEKMSPYDWQNLPAKTVDQGNPSLQPQYNYNYDMYLSFYTGKIGLFTVGAFYKKLIGQVLDYRVTMVDNKAFGFPDSYKGSPYTKPINNQWPGYVKGLELDWQTQFSYLPKPFNGIILNTNLTMMNSETRYPFYELTNYNLDPALSSPPKKQYSASSRSASVIGMPNLIANVSLGYEIGGFSGRISAYKQRATISKVQNSQMSIDESILDITKIDLQLSQKIKAVKGLMLYLNLNNLSDNSDEVVLTHYPDRLISYQKYGVSGDIGIRYKF